MKHVESSNTNFLLLSQRRASATNYNLERRRIHPPDVLNLQSLHHVISKSVANSNSIYDVYTNQVGMGLVATNSIDI